MSDQTKKLKLPLIMPSQAQKHVTHNEAIELLDVIVQLTVDSVTAQTPPTFTYEGQTWVIGSDPTGSWAGKTGMIVTWSGGGWLFVQPREGWMAWVKDDSALKVLTGGAWVTLASVNT